MIYALKYSFGLVCSIDKCKKNLYIVTIFKEYVKIFQTIILPHIIPTSRCEVGLDTRSNSRRKAVYDSRRLRFYSTMNKASSSSSSSSDNSSSVPAASYTNPIILKSVIYKENRKRLKSTVEQI